MKPVDLVVRHFSGNRIPGNPIAYFKAPNLVDSIGISSRAVVKGSGFFGAGSASVIGLLTAMTFTADGDAPTCTVNGTLTFPGPDCWNIRAYLDGILWAYWPGINVGQTTELDASGNGHHLTVLATTTITERLDGTGTNYCNESGYSEKENLITDSFDLYETITNMWRTANGATEISPNTFSLADNSSSYLYEKSSYTGYAEGDTLKFTAKISGTGTLKLQMRTTNGLYANSAQIPLTTTPTEYSIERILGVGDTGTDCRFVKGVADGVATCMIESVSMRKKYGLAYKEACQTNGTKISGRQPKSLKNVMASPGTVVVIGDSLAYGYAPYLDRLCMGRATITNKGVGGEKSEAVLTRFAADTEIAAKILLLVGINDVLSELSADIITDNIIAMAQSAILAGKEIILSTLTPIGNYITYTAPMGVVLTAANAAISQYGADHGITVIPLYDTMRDGSILRTYYDDGSHLHYSPVGYRVAAGLAYNAIYQPTATEADATGGALVNSGSVKLNFTMISGTGPSDWVVKFSDSPLVRSILGINNIYFDVNGVSLEVAYADLGNDVYIFDGKRGVVLYSVNMSALTAQTNRAIGHQESY
jgi:lysophospholipase L1-like esterase